MVRRARGKHIMPAAAIIRFPQLTLDPFDDLIATVSGPIGIFLPPLLWRRKVNNMTWTADEHLSVYHNPSCRSADKLLVTHLISTEPRDVPTSPARIGTKQPVEDVHGEKSLNA